MQRLLGAVFALVALSSWFVLPALAEEPPPSLSLISVSIKRDLRSTGDRFAGVAEFRVRLCVSNGPRAMFQIRERRTVGGKPVVSEQWINPLGVDLAEIYPRTCVSNYLVSWAIKARLIGRPGTYSVTIRVRDGYGRWSNPVGASIKAGTP
ncbi:MAG: hypothetical protein RMM28_08980 [Thermoleophilia bacterium]|nr:hypothetical protein [Gaiellaceae bacterium]MDW8339257.1 hypothetical protein [Thermoleophilia bacterium]